MMACNAQSERPEASGLTESVRPPMEPGSGRLLWRMITFLQVFLFIKIIYALQGKLTGG